MATACSRVDAPNFFSGAGDLLFSRFRGGAHFVGHFPYAQPQCQIGQALFFSVAQGRGIGLAGGHLLASKDHAIFLRILEGGDDWGNWGISPIGLSPYGRRNALGGNEIEG